MSLSVRTITAEQHLEHLESRPSASFLQTPAWGEVKTDWRSESIGWFDGERLAGVGLVLYRQLPKVQRFLAYLPEGPVIDWDDEDLSRWLDPMVAHVRSAGAFAVRMGPPVVCRRWDAQAVKDGIADDGVRRLGDVAPTERSSAGARVVGHLQEAGWKQVSGGEGFAAGQPQYNFWVPLRDADGAALDEDAVLKAMNQQWRRNIKKAAKEGVEVRRGSLEPSGEDLAAFHALYLVTAERDGFTPRPLAYFQRMAEALGGEHADRFRLYLAHHEQDLVAATIWVSVGRHTWYSYGASSSDKREVRGSNAAQWQMIRDSLELGADVYDLRGITDTLDADDDHVGLIRFKVGTGGEAVEYAGEWDLPIRPLLYRGFVEYLKRRG